MSLNKISAINYNKACKYSQQAIGIIQMFVRARTLGEFDEQTVEAVYKMQQSPLYGFAPGSADGKVGPGTLGVMIMELEHVSRMSEAAVLRSYCYRIAGETKNPHKKPHVYKPGANNDDYEEDEIIILEDEPVKDPTRPFPKPDKNKDFPRPVWISELRDIWTGPGTIPHPGSGPAFVIGRYYLAMKDIRKILGTAGDDIYYIVVQTESAALDPFLVGKVHKQTKRGFWGEINSAALAEVGRNAKGGQEMMKKEVELLMGAACAAVGAFGGFAAITAMSMNVLLMNNKEIFTVGNAIQELLKVSRVLSQHTPEFWLLSKTVLKLGMAKTPETLWNDPYAGTRLAGELVIIVGEAVLLRQFRSFKTVLAILSKLMLSAFAKLTDAATIALHGKDLIAEMKKLDPNVNDERAIKIIKELKANWKIVEPALISLKAVIDQLVGA
jgi:hypothetical protein